MGELVIVGGMCVEGGGEKDSLTVAILNVQKLLLTPSVYLWVVVAERERVPRILCVTPRDPSCDGFLAALPLDSPPPPLTLLSYPIYRMSRWWSFLRLLLFGHPVARS